MKYTIEWIEPPWLLLLTIEGQIVLSEYERMTNEQIKYLDQANGNLYWVCDLRALGEHTGTGLDYKIFASILEAAALRHPRSGLYSVVGSGAMMHFVVSSVVQRAGSTTPLWLVATVAEAEQQCRKAAAIDPNRATSTNADKWDIA